MSFANDDGCEKADQFSNFDEIEGEIFSPENIGKFIDKMQKMRDIVKVQHLFIVDQKSLDFAKEVLQTVAIDKRFVCTSSIDPSGDPEFNDIYLLKIRLLPRTEKCERKTSVRDPQRFVDELQQKMTKFLNNLV